ncbi:hypothetical protein [Microbispora triticiradicis]|uniref:Uncharacterized protein n=2 Tax=Microbispora TaxID=2005 RepID=A0ABY3LTZ0_9ACTN|nr:MULTISPECIES: hypothetical protein [Microbispora]TLP58856.1 hypothetical protein FED44_18645 [Microbispora fusca]TYB52131.1 hypothetical protein FXF59_25145 [Microbispora tritici]
MPQVEERIDVIERDVADFKNHVRLQNAMLTKCGEQLSDLRMGQHELQKGQEELRATTAELRVGQEELRAITDDLRTGQDQLRAGQDELRKGQEELRGDTAAIRETLEDFRGLFAFVMDEIRLQKAWREEFSDKLARVIAKSEGVEA